MARWIRFILAILVGIAAGLFYGWMINPVKYVDTTPDSLRIDYQSDYVLMVAESYSAEGDLAMSVRRLALLGTAPPADTVQQAILFAESQGYTDADVALMQALYLDLQAWNPSVEIPAP
ncbi:MAG: hypothetical protein PVF74_08875 [Anaerolineales bacterium]|jgi:hypothetical protein